MATKREVCLHNIGLRYCMSKKWHDQPGHDTGFAILDGDGASSCRNVQVMPQRIR